MYAQVQPNPCGTAACCLVSGVDVFATVGVAPCGPRDSSEKYHNDLKCRLLLTCICLIAGCLSGEKSRDSVTRSDVTA